jgi:hypothetical protein
LKERKKRGKRVGRRMGSERRNYGKMVEKEMERKSKIYK